MERLHRKGVLDRRKEGRAFLYRPVNSRDEMESGLVTRALGSLLQSQSAQPILSCLVDEVGRHDQRLLDELERLVREKRRQQADAEDGAQ
jgi:predicted transcriptional regulator